MAEAFDLSQLQGLLSMFAPTEDDKRSAKMQGIAEFGLGLLGARKGREAEWLGRAAYQGLDARDRSLANVGQGRMQQMQQAQAAMGLQEGVQKMQDTQADKAFLKGYKPSGPQMPSMAPTNENAAALAAQPKPGVYEQLTALAEAAQKAGRVRLSQDYLLMAEKYAPKYKGTETVMKDGKPVLLQQYENRAPTEMGYQPKPQLRFENMGDKTLAIDELATAPGTSFARSMSPSETDASKRGWAGLSQAERHFQANQAKESRPQIVTGPNGEVYAVNPSTGTGAAVVGPDGQPLNKGEKALTESQAKATAFANQMAAATDNINALKKGGFSGDNLFQQGAVAAASSGATRYFAPDAAQKYRQSELQWTEAALRFMTGANAPEPEVIRNAATYFPRPGDSAAVVKQKEASRKNMEESVRMAAGHGNKQLPEMGAAPAAGPKPGTLVDGHRFKGGDPNKRENWIPQ